VRPGRHLLAAARRAGTGRRPHAPRERLRLHRAQRRAAPSGAALIRNGKSEHGWCCGSAAVGHAGGDGRSGACRGCGGAGEIGEAVDDRVSSRCREALALAWLVGVADGESAGCVCRGDVTGRVSD
jgi:hypothetical protein